MNYRVTECLVYHKRHTNSFEGHKLLKVSHNGGAIVRSRVALSYQNH